MGTSKSYSAPPNWGDLKGKVTQETKEGITPEKAKELIKGLIIKKKQTHQIGDGSGDNREGEGSQGTKGARRQGKGGSSGGGTGGISSIKAASRFAGFASGVARDGLQTELKNSGLEDLSEAPISDISNKLVDYFCEPGSTFEQSDARNAMSYMIDDLLKDADTYDDVEQILVETATPEKMKEFIQEYFSLLIFEEFMRTFYEQVLHKNGSSKANNMEQQIRDYIIATSKNFTLDIDITDINWQGQEGREIAEKIKKQTIDIFGD